VQAESIAEAMQQRAHRQLGLRVPRADLRHQAATGFGGQSVGHRSFKVLKRLIFSGSVWPPDHDGSYDAAMTKKRTDDTVIDLFSGVGGLSLGAARAGFRVAASVELDKIASKSHKDNFAGTKHLETDVGKLSGESLLEAAGLRVGQLGGLIGGPPCQGFSLIGRREQTDPRNDLFVHFFRLVAETRPAFFVAENVPGILTGGQAIMERAFDLLPRNYVRLAPMRIEAQRYGAPTTRTRIFFVGYDPDRIDELNEKDFEPSARIKEVNVQDALAGLGMVKAEWQAEHQSWRAVGELDDTVFAKRVIGRVPRGVGNADALARLRQKREVSGFLGTKHTEETIRRFEQLAQGEVDTVYRSPRLRWKGFCPTLRAGTGREKGSYQAVRPIHPKFPRVISPREAARLQGFPDWFVFNPTKWHSFRQIGNSVSPLVAEKILRSISSELA
jgi:DNA (cytosine-5)-methyltransferase 1